MRKVTTTEPADSFELQGTVLNRGRVLPRASGAMTYRDSELSGSCPTWGGAPGREPQVRVWAILTDQQ
jgi:hypothetical protein